MSNISAEIIRKYLNNNDAEIKVFDCIDSTNSEAKRAVEAGLCRDAIFVAEKQTAGRGRCGKSFYSPSGTGLYFTAVLHPETGLGDATGITAAAAVAVADIIVEETKKDPKIKWVNDIFIGKKKVCGILAEAVADSDFSVKALIVGIGINLTTEVFPEELADIAASVGEIDRNKLAGKIFVKLKQFCDALPCRSFMEDYRRYSLILGKTITFSRNGIDYTAEAENISDDGSLEVVTDKGEKMLLNSGEISIKAK